MRSDDFAATCALEAYSRAAKILPLLDSWLEIEDQPPLCETQRIGLGLVVLQAFTDLQQTLERMVDVQETLEAVRRREPTLGEAVEEWLASRDQEGPLQ